MLLLWRLSTRGHSAGSLLGTTNTITSWSEQSRAECELVNNYKCQGNLYIPCLNHQTSVAVLALNVPLQSGSICNWVCGSHCSDLASILMLNHFGKNVSIVVTSDQIHNFNSLGKNMVFILSRLTVGLCFLLLLWFVAVSNGAHANIIICNVLQFFSVMVVLAAHLANPPHWSRFNSNRMYCSKTVMVPSG